MGVRPRLTRITLRGFKTIRELTDFEPGPLTVLIGPNGAGKTNFISFFRMLSWALAPPGNLQEHIGELGGASALLHDGPARTPQMEAALVLSTDDGENEYQFRLFYAAGDTLIYADEGFRFSPSDVPPELCRWTNLGAGHREAQLIARAERGDKTPGFILGKLRKIIVHQFHNTSATARMRNKWDVEDARWLKEDGANIAPFLFRLKNEQPGHYRRIVETIRPILPFFADFEFEQEHGKMLLRWRERGSDRVFNASQAGDGMLRLMALVALLQQPESDLPDVLILDEPELGLHPYAIETLAGLIRSVSTQVQVILATQSVALIDRFEPEDIVVVDRSGRESAFRRLGRQELDSWLAEYTMSELWEKNIIGGRPGL